jgi:hypothetical protein
MKFGQTRKAISTLKSKHLQKDIEGVIRSIERVARTDNELAGRRTSQLIGLLFALRHTLPENSRFSLVDAIFVDAEKAGVPPQWERKPGYECGKDNLCSKLNPKTTCYRDTTPGGVCQTK